MKWTYKVGAAVSGVAIVATAFAPAIFATTVDITNNGAESINTVSITSVCNASLVQKNNTKVKTNVDVSGSTGGNTASGNTGGDVSITTGDVTNDVTVTVGGSTNEASAIPDCCACSQGELAVTVADNGAASINNSTNTKVNTTSVKQKNKTVVKTKVKAKGKTGKNTASNNTNGTTDVTTGNVGNTVDVAVTAPSNTL